MSENLLTKYAKTEWFVIEKMEYDNGYEEEGFGHESDKAKADEYRERNNKNRGWGESYSRVFSRQVIDLDAENAFEILRNNPLQMMKDLGFGTYTKTESIFKIIHDFYNKYPGFFDAFTMQLRLPASYEYDYSDFGYECCGKKDKPPEKRVDKFSVPLQFAIGIRDGNKTIAMMDDDQTGHVYQCAGSYNWRIIPTFRWMKKNKDRYGEEHPFIPGSGLYILRPDSDKRFSEITRLGVHNILDFSRELDDEIFKPVFKYLKKQEAIFEKVHKQRPSWQYFNDKYYYLHGVVREIISKENSKIPYWKNEIITSCLCAQFENTYGNHRRPDKDKVTPKDYIDWLEKHPEQDWGYKSFYDFCIEHKCYELCDDDRNFGDFNTEGTYTRAGRFAREAHDMLFDMEMASHRAFIKRYLNCRKGNNHSLIKKFDKKILDTIESVLDQIPTMGELRERQRQEKEAAAKKARDEAEFARWERFDDDDD